MSLIITIIAFKFLKKSSVWNRLILQRFGSDEEKDKVSLVQEDLVGQEGVTLTALRPAGTVLLENGEHVPLLVMGLLLKLTRK
jgi:membrane-bound serine protease (ClpP class)